MGIKGEGGHMETEESRTLVDIVGLCERYPALKLWTVRALCSQGRIPHIKLGRSVYFDVAEIEAWLDAHARPAREAVGREAVR